MNRLAAPTSSRIAAACAVQFQVEAGDVERVDGLDQQAQAGLVQRRRGMAQVLDERGAQQQAVGVRPGEVSCRPGSSAGRRPGPARSRSPARRPRGTRRPDPGGTRCRARPCPSRPRAGCGARAPGRWRAGDARMSRASKRKETGIPAALKPAWAASSKRSRNGCSVNSIVRLAANRGMRRPSMCLGSCTRGRQSSRPASSRPWRPSGWRQSTSSNSLILSISMPIEVLVTFSRITSTTTGTRYWPRHDLCLAPAPRG